MKKNRQFILKFCVFILLAGMLNLLLNSAYNRWMYYNRFNRNQDKQFAEFSDTLKYLMLGNSHNILDPAFFGNSFSYVTPRELYPQTYYKLRYILEKAHKKPEFIFLSIDPLNFNPKAEADLTFDGYWRKYIDYFEMARDTRNPVYLLNWLKGTFFSYAGNFKFIFNTLLYINFDYSKIKNGYLPRRNDLNFARESNPDALGLERATAYLSGFERKSDLGSSRYYLRILDLCNKYDVVPILLRMPLSDEYLKHAYSMVNIKKLDQDIINLTRLHSDNFILFDFRNEFHGRPEYFVNADHVNPAGAKIISNKIKDRLVNDRNTNKQHFNNN